MSKYEEFQEKMKKVATICGYNSKDVAALKYKQLLGEVLEQFKLLEDSLEWRKKVEAKEWGDDDSDYFESEEERQEWNDFWKKKIEEARGK